MITDFYDDTNQQQLYSIDHLCGLPDFVKKAEVEDPESLKTIAPTTYADAGHMKFPCHTKAATWLANAYFQLARGQYHKKEAAFVQERLLKFAAFWSIRGLVEKFNQVWSKVATFNRDDLPDEQHALVVKIAEDGRKIRRFPMPNAMSVKMAGEHLYANRASFPYEWRKTAARNILKEALRYDELVEKGVKVAGAAFGTTRFEPATLEYLERAAGFGMTHPLKAAEKCAQRAYMLRDNFKDYAEKMAEIATTLREAENASPAQMAKLAAVVDAVDRETGLCNHYYEGVDLPEEMFFDVLEKEAEEILDSFVTLTTGNTYPVGVFASIALEKIAAVMGTEFSAAVTGADGCTVDAVKFAERKSVV